VFFTNKPLKNNDGLRRIVETLLVKNTNSGVGVTKNTHKGRYPNTSYGMAHATHGPPKPLLMFFTDKPVTNIAGLRRIFERLLVKNTNSGVAVTTPQKLEF
jgi:hypothetical protein